MHLITDNLLVGSIDDAQGPPEVVGTLLLVAEEFTITPAAWVDYHRIPFREFAKVDPAKLAEAVQWLESRASKESDAGLLSGRHGSLRVRGHGLSLLRGRPDLR